MCQCWKPVGSIAQCSAEVCETSSADEVAMAGRRFRLVFSLCLGYHVEGGFKGSVAVLSKSKILTGMSRCYFELAKWQVMTFMSEGNQSYSSQFHDFPLYSFLHVS